MKNESRKLVSGRLWPLLNQHWFKIGLVLLVFYAVLSKDLSFNISIEAPTPSTTQPQQDSELHHTNQGRGETLTDNTLNAAQATSHFDLLPSWGNTPNTQLMLLLEQIDQEKIGQFVKRFAHVAETEQEKYGIPASIIIAQGLLQSMAGQHPAAAKGKNYFLLKCTDDWQGQTQDGKRSACLRRYDNAWMSFRDHSLFLTTGNNGHLRRLKGASYQQWAIGIQESAHNDNDQLAEQLTHIIQAFNLEQYDD